MVALQKTSPRWSDLCIVAGSGPSLTPEIAAACKGHPVIAVNDAWRLLPFADVLYACDEIWWSHHGGCREFAGEKWSSHGTAQHNDKRAAAAEFGLRLIKGASASGFSYDPAIVHYGEMSGFQAANLAGHFLGWRGRVVLVGFDLCAPRGRRHFFGDHPKGLRSTIIGPHGTYEKCIKCFEVAAASLPPEIEIVNCSPLSALHCFRMMDIADATG